MGDRYITDLADLVRSLGLPCIEVGASAGQTGSQWKTRARGSGGYDAGRPNHVMLHHTASRTSATGWADANYCTFVSPARPVANLVLGRDGTVFVCAAGATNTNGVGIDPCGKTAKDSMNRDAIAVEASNNGQGEPWGQAQTDNYLVLVRGLCNHYGIPFSCAHSHEEYAPTRKIDPAGPPRWIDPPDRPGTQIWNMNAFRAELANVTTPPPVEPPPVTTPPPVVTPPPQTSDWWTPLMASMPTLKQGNSGVFVKRMQHLIAAAGYMNPGNVSNYDGAFGSGTATALRNFQSAAGITVDAVCGPQTWGALMHTINGIPVIKNGARGDDVERMQHLLASAGFMSESNVSNYDGAWGSGTEQAKVKFDNAKGLTPSPPSDCGKGSWTKLLKG